MKSRQAHFEIKLKGMHPLNLFMPSKLIQHFRDLALNLRGERFFYSSEGRYDVCVRDLTHEQGMQSKVYQVAFGFMQLSWKACGPAEVVKCPQAFLESKPVSNYSHPFSPGLIFTLCSIFLSHISPHRGDNNFGVKLLWLFLDES